MKTDKNPQIFWTIILLTIVGLIWAGFSFFGDKNGDTIDTVDSSISEQELVPLGEGQSINDISSSEKRFKHSILGFNFSYLKDYSISSFGNYFDSVGETILLQKDGGNSSLQVLVTPFDEDISLSIARIKKDLPSLNVTDARELTLGVGNIPQGSPLGDVQAVVFSSTNNLSTGKSLEAWFIYRKNLYQISAPDSSKSLFDKITSSWKLE